MRIKCTLVGAITALTLMIAGPTAGSATSLPESSLGSSSVSISDSDLESLQYFLDSNKVPKLHKTLSLQN